MTEEYKNTMKGDTDEDFRVAGTKQCRAPKEVGDGMSGGGSLPVVITPRDEKLRLNYRPSKAYTPK
jgi:hypothetical protein